MAESSQSITSGSWKAEWAEDLNDYWKHLLVVAGAVLTVILAAVSDEGKQLLGWPLDRWFVLAVLIVLATFFRVFRRQADRIRKLRSALADQSNPDRKLSDILTAVESIKDVAAGRRQLVASRFFRTFR